MRRYGKIKPWRNIILADLETTTAKLRSTPTGGVSGEHSAYYRRLLSAGYKGYVQGAMGGGTLYGAIGMAIGGAVGIPLMIGLGGAPLALLLVPGLGTAFGLYGSHVFADIGKTAAIIADSAELNEKRRYLLDRYYDTPSEAEAGAIKEMLQEEHESRKPEKVWHWRSAAFGATVGIALAITTVAIAPYFAPHFIPSILGFLGLGAGHGAVASLGLALPAIMGVGAAIGGLAGSVLGIDREHIRGWLDRIAKIFVEPSHAEHEIAQRERQIQRLTEAAQSEVQPAKVERPAETPHVPIITPEPERQLRPAPLSPHEIAGIDKPMHAHASSIEPQGRLAAIHAAMANPVL